MVNYGNSIIYKLCSTVTPDDIYIGSTTNFSRRKNCHKSNCTNETNHYHNYPVYQFIRDNGGWSAWSMIQIEAYEAKNKRDLEARERYYIDLLKPNLNKRIPTRTQKEYKDDNRGRIIKRDKLYRDLNKDQIKAYVELNKDRIKDQKKQWHVNNKARINQKVICNCGCEVNNRSLTRHKTRTSHQFYEKLHNFINS